MTAVRTAVLFGPASVLHRPGERLPDVTACRRSMPAGAVTTPQRTALLSALVHGIPRCITCYPDHQMCREVPVTGRDSDGRTPDWQAFLQALRELPSPSLNTVLRVAVEEAGWHPSVLAAALCVSEQRVRHRIWLANQMPSASRLPVPNPPEEVRPIPRRRFPRRTPKQVAQLVADFHDGMSVDEIAARDGVPVRSVVWALTHAGVDVPARRDPTVARAVPGIVAGYKAGATIAELAGRFELSPNTVRTVLIDAGVPRRPRGGRAR